MIKQILRKTAPRFYTEVAGIYSRSSVKWRSKGPTEKIIKSRLASQQPIYLEIGSGAKKGKNGWITSDICRGADIWMDLLNTFPWPDGSVDKIYSSHVFEHFYTHELQFILAECRRILKVGGIISVCVPNAEIYLQAYEQPDSFDADKFCGYKTNFHFYSKMDYVNYVAYLGGKHRHMFDQENLVQLLARNGFRNARSRSFDPEIDLPERDFQSIYAEAEK